MRSIYIGCIVQQTIKKNRMRPCKLCVLLLIPVKYNHVNCTEGSASAAIDNRQTPFELGYCADRNYVQFQTTSECLLIHSFAAARHIVE